MWSMSTAPDRRAKGRDGRAYRVALGVAAAGALALPLIALAATRGSAAGPPSFSREIAPLVEEKCAGCHQLGGIAPFAFRTARDLTTRSAAVTAMVKGGLMPPWPPGPDSPRYRGEARRTLTEAQRATLLDWISRAPRAATGKIGAPRAAATPAAPGERLLRLSLPTPYRPAASGGGTDDYRCFLLDPGLDRDVFVTSARIEPGAAAVVHHVILFRVPPASVAAARRVDARSAAPGWSCFGGTGVSLADGQGAVRALDDAPWIGAWAPGWGGERLPRGLGIPLGKGSQVIMQVHYNLLNGSQADRSSAVLTTVPAIERLTRVETTLLPAPVEVPCADGESGPLCDRDAASRDQVQRLGPDAGFFPLGLLLLCGKDAAKPPVGPTSFCDRPISQPTTIRAVAGHMHLLGASIKVELNPGTPRALVLLDIPRWDFHWQAMYTLANPVEARAGDVLRVTCRYDASRRSLLPAAARTPRYMLWGEGTTDEMCLGIVQVTRG
jgi:hypothetical protein